MQKYIVQDLSTKMVFLWGPRQVWKTTLSKHIAKDYSSSQYFNWDFLEDKKRILSGSYDTGVQLVILGEIHKYENRKNFVKWEFDVHNHERSYLVTWSARLNIYKKWWDSLLWRYRYYRLHPYSLAELDRYDQDWYNMAYLLQYSWFPEVYESWDERTHRRWLRSRRSKLIREDIRDLTDIKSIAKLELLVSVLETKVWSPFSIASLVEDIQVTRKTLSQWIDALEYIYYAWRIYPYQSTKIKSLRKIPKLYLWDWSEIEDSGARIENFVWSHLLKRVHYQQDVEWYDINISYLRDREWREVDFVLMRDGIVTHLIEVKKKDTNVTRHLKYFHKKFPEAEAIQLVYDIPKTYDRTTHGIRVVGVEKFLLWLV